MALTGEARERELAQSLLEVRTRVANATQSASRAIDEITLIAVTKTYPASDVEILSKHGIRVPAPLKHEVNDPPESGAQDDAA